MRIFKFGPSAILSIAVVCASSHSFAAILSSWTFSDFANVTAASGPSIASDPAIFPGTFQGVHASATSVWSSPVGNGSTDSYSANGWAVNDYYQINTSSLGYDTLTLTLDGTGSNTGPRDFKVAASTDGVSFTDIGFSYTLTNDGWSSGTPNPVSTKTTSLPVAYANQASLYLRLIQTSAVAISSANPVAATGTSRIDNVIVAGELIGPIVPEPSSIALVFASVGTMAFRRK